MNKNQEEDILGDNHIATSAVTPLRADAFQLNETEKIAACYPPHFGNGLIR